MNSFDFDDIHRFFIFATSRRKEPSFVHSWPNKSEEARGREKKCQLDIFSATLHSSFAIVRIWRICVTRKWNNNLLSERGCMQQRKRVVRMDVKPTGGGNGKTLPSFSWIFFWRNMSEISTMINDLTHENSIIML